jgi:hypothetical protein
MFPVASFIVVATLAILGFAGDTRPERELNQAWRKAGEAKAKPCDDTGRRAA